MDIQLKKGLLDICVLACLNKGDSYGYQIIKDLGPIIEISESTLYPVLKRLESSKMVMTYEVAHNGRLRKYFKITRGGVGKLKEFEHEQDELMRIYRYIENSVTYGVADSPLKK